MKHCKLCKADNPDYANYCHMCGNKLSGKNRIKIMGAIMAIGFFLLGMSGFINPDISVILSIVFGAGGYILQDIRKEQ